MRFAWYQTKEKARKAYKQAQKLAFAVVLVQFLMAGSWLYLEKSGIMDNFTRKTVVFVFKSEAKQHEKDTKQPEKNTIEQLKDYIWLHESTKGKNNFSKCEALGKVNGIGFGIHGDKWQCFESHAEEMVVLEGWLRDKESRGLTEKQMLCLYNTGQATNSCSYASKWQ